MKRCLSVLLVLCVLLLAGCGKKSNTPPPAEPEPTEDIASVPAPPPPVEDKVTVYTFGKLEIPVACARPYMRLQVRLVVKGMARI